MLSALSIRNIVLIDELHLDFTEGLSVLTGETGAGKSILLDALGLALGARAETRYLRRGAQSAEVTACFSLALEHPLWDRLDEQEIVHDRSEIMFRRHLGEDGKSKCFLNDQLISQTFMKQLGQQLVEIHGQFDQLRDTKAQLTALDSYGKINNSDVYDAFKTYQSAKKERNQFHEKLAQSTEREVFLRFAIEDLERAHLREGEEEELESEKSLIAHRAKIADALSTVEQNFGAVLSNLSQSHKALDRVQEYLPEKIAPLMEATDRAILETQEVIEGMTTLARNMQGTQQTLESIENRLYTLKALGRKYNSQNLVTTLAEFNQELSSLEQAEDYIEDLERTVETSRQAYLLQAQTLSDLRKQSAHALEEALANELPPLKLEHAKFWIKFEQLEEDRWGSNGIDHIEFYTQMNPGTPGGPLIAIASGGELSRLMLALKVVLTQSEAVPTLIFDEIESGTGGAVAAAMGERLKGLSQNLQLLAITHSPQIAAHGAQHLVVFKVIQNGETTTHVKALEQGERGEEIARMLAGEEITEEARAAARRLMGTSRI